MGDAAEHAHGPNQWRVENRRRMAIALAINLAMLVAELVGGLLTGSLALLADAGHVLSDVGSIALGLLAATLAARPAKGRRTFGYQRTEILAALANGLALVAIAIGIVIVAVLRFGDPPEIDGGGVLALGVAGLAGNLAATLVLHGGERRDVNLEGVLRHSFADALGSLGVIVSGGVILATGWDQVDTVVSLAIAVLVLASSWRLIREPLEVLMEAAPPGLEVAQIAVEMLASADVIEVHDLHVWTVTSGFPALSAHVVVSPSCDRDLVRHELERVLRERFGIDHTTLQMVRPPQRGLLEVEAEPPDGGA